MAVSPRPSTSIYADLVILGGGVAGLWLLDVAHRAGYRAVLLEAHALGQGQTVAAQGIIHGGLKYTLRGVLTRAADAIKDMPQLWRQCLDGRGQLNGLSQPDLRGTTLRAPHCLLWRTESIMSKVGMVGARAGLRVAPVKLDDDAKPALLRRWVVDRLDEQVISPASMLQVLAKQHEPRLLEIDANHIRFHQRGDRVEAITLQRPATGKREDGSNAEGLTIEPRHVVLTAGGGNEAIRAQLGLPSNTMQRRPLHMPMARAAAGRDDLPRLNAHCVDGNKTRVTITSDTDTAGRTVWQIGGQISEDGVALKPDALLQRTREELATVLPDLDQSGLAFASFRVDRAEQRTRSGARPDDAHAVREGNVITAWPTKMALAPLLAQRVLAMLDGEPRGGNGEDAQDMPAHWPADWPRPAVADPPWEQATWT